MQTTGRFVRFLFQALAAPTNSAFGRNHPVLDFPFAGKAIFSVRLTVSWLVPQLHNLPGQQPQRPVGVLLSEAALVQGDDLGFRLAVKDLRHRRRPLPFQRPTFLDEIPVNVLDRLPPTREPPRSTPTRRRPPSAGSRRILWLLPLRTVSWQISRSSAVNRTSCTWECLSVAHTNALDRKYSVACQLFY